MNIKKFFAILLAGLMLLSFAACADKDEETEDPDDILADTNIINNLKYDTNGEGTYEITGFTYKGTEPKNIVIPAEIDGRDVTGIANDAFKAFKTIKSVKFEEGSQLKYIGKYAFWGCTALTSVTLPATVTEIGNGAFRECEALTSIVLPASLNAVNNYTFMGCSALASVTVSEGVKAIGEGAFQGCTALTSVTLPASLEKLGDSAFYGCEKLASASVLSTKLTTENIGEMVFHGAASGFTATVTAESDFAKYAAENGYTK